MNENKKNGSTLCATIFYALTSPQSLSHFKSTRTEAPEKQCSLFGEGACSLLRLGLMEAFASPQEEM